LRWRGATPGRHWVGPQFNVDQKVSAAALSQHTGASHRSQQFEVTRGVSDLLRGVVGAAVGVQDHLAGQFAAQGDRPTQFGPDEVGAHVVFDGPAEHPAGVPVAARAQVEPSDSDRAQERGALWLR
jgi:hypothetical protein